MTEGPTPARVFTPAFAALVLLVAVTVALSYLPVTPRWAVPVQAGLAFLRCLLIAGIFMHAGGSGKAIRALLWTVLFLSVFLFGAVLADLGRS